MLKSQKRGECLLVLGERKLKILAAIIDIYVKTGEPVSSKALCNLPDFSFSSATIRNEMAELTELGYLEQPHTSAGRIPSHLGYRLYINQLMDKKNISTKSKKIIDNSLVEHCDNPENLLNEAANLLASLTNMAVIQAALFSKLDTIKELQFVQTGSHTGLVLLITSSGVVKNRFFRCNYTLSEEVLEECTKIFNSEFINIPLVNINENFIKKVADKYSEILSLINPILTSIFLAIKDIIKLDVKLEGQSNLLLFPDFDFNSIINISNFLNKGNNITNFITSLPDNNTKVVIGKETPFEQLSDSSIVITNYTVGGKTRGIIGTIGPVRMDYSDTIANLEYIASSISEILSGLLSFD